VTLSDGHKLQLLIIQMLSLVVKHISKNTACNCSDTQDDTFTVALCKRFSRVNCVLSQRLQLEASGMIFREQLF